MGRRLGTIFIAAMVATLAGSAYSQKQTPEQLAAEEKREKAIDEAYKAAVDRAKVNQTAPAVVDPWGSVREPTPSQKK